MPNEYFKLEDKPILISANKKLTSLINEGKIPLNKLDYLSYSQSIFNDPNDETLNILSLGYKRKFRKNTKNIFLYFDNIDIPKKIFFELITKF